MPYTFTLAHGFQIARRAVGFLESATDAALNAKRTFDGLKETKRMLVSNRFRAWLDGIQNKKWFHGWDGPVYKPCHVFKWDDKRVGQRLYGFKCHPRPVSDPGFMLCVLVCHATKSQWETEESEMDRVLGLFYMPEVKTAIRSSFPEFR